MKSQYLKKKFFNRTLLDAFSALFNSFLIYITSVLNVSIVSAQIPQFCASDVHSVEFRHANLTDRSSSSVPQLVVCHLSIPEILSLDFDIINREQLQLAYSFAHFNADWSPSDLMEIEFVSGFNKVYGSETVSLSFNTLTPYAHYHLDISTAPLLVSGNYMLQIRTVDDDALILSLPLWVSEDVCGIQSRILQQDGTQTVQFSVIWPNHGILNPEQELHISVWQNKRLDDIRQASSPTFIRPDEIVYLTAPELTFCPGAEWRWLDTRSVKYVTMKNAHIQYIDPFYHFTLPTDLPNRAYTFREDFNGGQWFENKDRHIEDPTIAAEYVMAHLSFLPTDPNMLSTHNIYVIGDAAGWEPSSQNLLSPDYETGLFQGQLIVKQGLHNYQYVATPQSPKSQHSHIAHPTFAETEGCFIETENDYFIAVYARCPGQTYDHLLSLKIHNTLKTPDSFIK